VIITFKPSFCEKEKGKKGKGKSLLVKAFFIPLGA